MRLHSQIWVSAFIRQVQSGGASAMLTRRGSELAGAIYIKVSTLDSKARLFSPAPSLSLNDDVDRVWMAEFGDEAKDEREIDLFLKNQAEFDTDIWVVEVEDREGRHFLADQLLEGDLF